MPDKADGLAAELCHIQLLSTQMQTTLHPALEREYWAGAVLFAFLFLVHPGWLPNSINKNVHTNINVSTSERIPMALDLQVRRTLSENQSNVLASLCRALLLHDRKQRFV